MSGIGPVLILAGGLSPGLAETSTLPMAVASAGLDLGAVFRDLLVQAADRGSQPRAFAWIRSGAALDSNLAF